MKRLSRESDEQILLWLRMRDEGLSVREIARRVGRAHETIRRALNAVDAAG